MTIMIHSFPWPDVPAIEAVYLPDRSEGAGILPTGTPVPSGASELTEAEYADAVERIRARIAGLPPLVRVGRADIRAAWEFLALDPVELAALTAAERELRQHRAMRVLFRALFQLRDAL